jgi:hypothetical protein
MGKLNMAATMTKAETGANTQAKPIGVELFLDQIVKAEPFASLYAIKPDVLAAIKADMAEKGFDHSKPVNVWKRADGSRVLVDGYTRMRAVEELGFMKLTAYEMSFADDAEALAYAIHTQRDRRNISDAELLHLVEIVDKPQEGQKKPIAPSGANEIKPKKTAEITAEQVGTSTRQVERARTVLDDPEQAEAVLAGRKSINQAAKDARAKVKPISKPAPKARHTVASILAALEKRINEETARAAAEPAGRHGRKSRDFISGRIDGLHEAWGLLHRIKDDSY